MRTQTGPRFNVSSEGRGTTTRVAHPYPYGTSRAGNRTRVVVGGVPDANHYTTGPVCLSVCVISIAQTVGPILMKLYTNNLEYICECVFFAVLEISNLMTS